MAISQSKLFKNAKLQTPPLVGNKLVGTSEKNSDCRT